tara:strand:+ start:734 stop:1594 length:861 start_codon:yes stop_codon:yes gene_type:complete
MPNVITSGGVVLSVGGIITNRGGIINNRGGVILTSGLDPDAAAYIAAIRATGATVDSNQVGEINTFYKAAKTGGYYTSLKRLYLPIWGVAAANAIDLITGASGTFNGGVTHGAGFIQSDGTTGYFALQGNPNALEMTSGSAFAVSLVYTNETTSSSEVLIGGQDGAGASFSIIQNSHIYDIGDEAVNRFSDSSPSFAGIYLLTKVGSNAVVNKRVAAGFSIFTSQTSAPAGTLPTSMTAPGRNGTVPGDNKYGAYGIGTGLAQPEAESFTLALKTLWENCTSLTLA